MLPLISNILGWGPIIDNIWYYLIKLSVKKPKFYLSTPRTKDYILSLINFIRQGKEEEKTWGIISIGSKVHFKSLVFNQNLKI